jgi:hypothetical protein
MPAKIERSVAFWRHVIVGPDCWLWIGGGNRKGYGCFGYDKTSMMAHRMAFWLVRGRKPTSELHHICKNRRCVNPAHLVEVTRREHAKEWTRDVPRCGHAYDLIKTRSRGTTDRLCADCRTKWRRAYEAKWLKTPKGIAYKKAKTARYRLSEAGKAAKERWTKKLMALKEMA